MSNPLCQFLSQVQISEAFFFNYMINGLIAFSILLTYSYFSEYKTWYFVYGLLPIFFEIINGSPILYILILSMILFSSVAEENVDKYLLFLVTKPLAQLLILLVISPLYEKVMDIIVAALCEIGEALL